MLKIYLLTYLIPFPAQTDDLIFRKSQIHIFGWAPLENHNFSEHETFVEYGNPLVISFQAILDQFKPNVMTQNPRPRLLDEQFLN